MGPLRDGELLWVSKERLSWATACREGFFLHMRLQSTPLHWTTYFFYATGDRPPPSYCKASQLYHICRTSLSSIGDALHHWRLSPEKRSWHQSTSCPRMSLPWLPVSLLTGLLWTASMCTRAGPSGDNGGWAAIWRQAHHRLWWHRVHL